MNIRQARLEDSEKLHILIMDAVNDQRYADFDEEGWKNFCIPNAVPSIQNRLQNNEYLSLCYVEADEILGIITMHKLEKLDQLFIHPSARRRGIATQLWHTAKSICEADGRIPKYWLKSSPLAVPLYQSFGFQLTGDQTKANGISFFPMEFVP